MIERGAGVCVGTKAFLGGENLDFRKLRNLKKIFLMRESAQKMQKQFYFMQKCNFSLFIAFKIAYYGSFSSEGNLDSSKKICIILNTGCEECSVLYSIASSFLYSNCVHGPLRRRRRRKAILSKILQTATTAK